MKVKPRNQQQTILVVDDERATFDLVAHVLAGQGGTLLWAGNRARALVIAANTGLDLVILDLNLPDCGGLELMRELKGIYPNLTVIILTGYGSQDSAREAMEGGVLEYLTKPFQARELQMAVRSALESESVLQTGVGGRHV